MSPVSTTRAPLSMRTPLARPSPTSSRASACAAPPAAMRSVRGRSRMRSRIAPVSPSATRRPFTSTTTRGAMRSTSCSTCEETSTVRPSAPSRRISSTTCRRWTGSRPLSGSSSSSSSGECTSAWASLTRCRMPFEKPPTRRSAASSRPTLAIASAAARGGSGTSRRPAIISTSSRAVRNGQSPSRSCTMPIRR